MTHSTAICDSIAAIPPYSYSREGGIDLRYPPPPRPFLTPPSTNVCDTLMKHGGVQKSTGKKVPCKIGVLIYLPVTSRPLISLQKEAFLSPCSFATAHLTACILDFYLPCTSRPMKRRTLSQRPKKGGIARYPAIPRKRRCDRYSYTL